MAELGKSVNNPKPEIPDKFTLYCEDKVKAHINGFGEDGYPVARDNFIMTADGLGSGSQRQASLKDVTPEELVGLLFDPNGEGMDAESKEYILDQSFAVVPPESIFNGSKTGPGSQYCDPDLSKRTSAYLGARIVTSAIFQKYHGVFFDEQELTAQQEAACKDEWSTMYAKSSAFTAEMETYIDRDLRERIFSVKKDGVNLFSTKLVDFGARTQGYLPTTFATVFFDKNSNRPESKYVYALVIWCGDARCYKIDTLDGMVLLSTDDAESISNDLTGYIHYGEVPKRDAKFSHNRLKFRLFKVEKPCAFMSCTDGIVDTCVLPEYKDEADTQNELAFKRELDSLFKQSYTLDTLRLGLAYVTYAGRDAYEGHESYCEDNDWTRFVGQQYSIFGRKGIKVDDSATVSFKAFWTHKVKSPRTLVVEKNSFSKMNELSLRGVIDGYPLKDQPEPEIPKYRLASPDYNRLCSVVLNVDRLLSSGFVDKREDAETVVESMSIITNNFIIPRLQEMLENVDGQSNIKIWGVKDAMVAQLSVLASKMYNAPNNEEREQGKSYNQYFLEFLADKTRNQILAEILFELYEFKDKSEAELKELFAILSEDVTQADYFFNNYNLFDSVHRALSFIASILLEPKVLEVALAEVKAVAPPEEKEVRRRLYALCDDLCGVDDVFAAKPQPVFDGERNRGLVNKLSSLKGAGSYAELLTILNKAEEFTPWGADRIEFIPNANGVVKRGTQKKSYLFIDKSGATKEYSVTTLVGSGLAKHITKG